MRRPRFIAEQARNARGPLGRLIASIMARETWAENVRAIEALEVRDREQVLDLGCGHGRALGTLAGLTPAGRVVGVDPSQLMADIAVAKNREFVRRGRVEVATAAADRLPFADAAFDKALCVHVAYFWPDLAVALGEISRVLKPGGRLALLARTDADPATASFPTEVYRFRSRRVLCAALRSAGFEPETVDPGREPALIVARRAPSP